MAIVSLVLAAAAVTALGAAAAPPSGYVPMSALIDGDSVTTVDGITDAADNPISLEEYAAEIDGYTVTVASPADWDAMSAADFAKYQLLIVGDPFCTFTPTSATSSASTWAPVVMGTSGQNSTVGNRVLVGTDPEYHYENGGGGAQPTTPGDPSTSGAEHLVQDGIAYAGGVSGATGVYFDTSCEDNSDTDVLNALSSTGTGFTEDTTPPCGGSVQLIASNPVFASLSDTDIQGWHCSDHITFPTYPTDWQPLAVATDTTSQPTCGTDPNTETTACGESYVLVAGEGIVVTAPDLTLTPATNSDPAGGTHTVTATVTQSGSPLSGQTVSFQITGQNAGVSGTCAPVSCMTDASGVVTFTYPDTNGAGSDTIDASVTISSTTEHATATETWTSTETPQADVSITKVGAPDPVTVGSNLTYTLTATNGGPDDAAAVTVSDTLPTGVAFVSSMSSVGSCTGTTTVACNLGTLANGASATVTIVVTANTAGPLSNTATVASTTDDPNSENNSATANTTVDPATAEADLSITKVGAPDPVADGGSLTYTLTVHNGGPGNAVAATVTDPLPAGVAFVSSLSSVGSCTGTTVLLTTTVTCNLGDLANGDSATVTIVVTATAAGPLSNTATVASSTDDPNPDDNSSTATTTVTPEADLSIVKVGAPDPAAVGSNVTYTLTVHNGGPDDAAAVTVTDVPPAGVTFVSAASGVGSCTGSTTVTCALGDLANGDSVTITIVVTANAAGPLSNTATVAATTDDPVSANDTSTATTTVEEQDHGHRRHHHHHHHHRDHHHRDHHHHKGNPPPPPPPPTVQADLSIVKTGAPDPVVAGSKLTYTLTVSNSGPDAAGAVTVTDPLPAGVTFVSASSTVGSCTGTTTVDCDLGALANGAGATITIVVTANAVGPLSNTATVAGTTADPNSSNNSSTATTTVDPATPKADLSIVKLAAPDPVTAGSNLTYTLTVHNAGPDSAVSVTVSDTLPAGVTLVSATPSVGSCTGTATVTCSLGTLASGSSATVAIVIKTTTAGWLSNTATVAATTDDPVSTNNSSTVTTKVKARRPEHHEKIRHPKRERTSRHSRRYSLYVRYHHR